MGEGKDGWIEYGIMSEGSHASKLAFATLGGGGFTHPEPHPSARAQTCPPPSLEAALLARARWGRWLA